jgi:uncharacterized protein YfdQ (DUF2303 family)
MTDFSDNNCAGGTNVGALADTIARFHEFDVIDASTKGTAPFAVVPEGKTIESLKPLLDEYRLLPDRRRGTSSLRDVASFVELVKRFASGESVVFASPDRTAPKLQAVFDYHPAGEKATAADWLQHKALYAPPLSEEWKAWSAKNGQSMSQADFAAFIDEHVNDLMVPALDDPKLKTYADLVEGVWAGPSQMVALSRKLQVNVESVVKNAQTLNSGELSIIYEEIHTDGAGQPLKVPTLFTICIPVFYAGQLYRIAARLRYRVANGKITWSYQLVRADIVFDDAFNGIVETVRKETALPVLLGTPEA